MSRTVVDGFLEIATRHAHSVAMATPTSALTYAEVHTRAEGIAAAVAASSHGPVIPLLRRHGVADMPAILGILMAGRAYAPLDPGHPPAYLARLVERLGGDLLLCDRAHVGLANQLLPDGHVLDYDDHDLVGTGSPPPRAAVSPEDLAWVTWTSGSTGDPKGVMATHASVLATIDAYRALLDIGPGDRLTQIHKDLTFDIFGAFLSGARLCAVDLASRGVGDTLTWLRDQRVTVFRAFPTTFRMLMGSCRERPELPDVRVIHLGGEPVHADDVARARAGFPRCARFLNVFGSAEGGLVAARAIRRDEPVPDDPLPIGTALPGVVAQVLDTAGRPLPGGEPGELHVESAQVAAGYWQEPARTAAAFEDVADGRRRYRTGDRIRKIGPVLFSLGRGDAQVKVRGHRIELLAVEAVLLEDASISAAVASVPRSGLAADQLVAHVVPTAGTRPTPTSIRTRMAETVPTPMVPSHILIVKALPRTAGGKVDRSALPQPETPSRSGEGEAMQAAPHLESVLRLWSEVLGGVPVRPSDTLLGLGGDSLKALRLSTRCQERFGLAISLERLFEGATPAELAAAIDTGV